MKKIVTEFLYYNVLSYTTVLNVMIYSEIKYNLSDII
jgi:hypothetical protein